jgi:GNAT superfamily N-acetyltransferase
VTQSTPSTLPETQAKRKKRIRVNNRHDLAPQWENYRQYWKGWGVEHSADGPLNIYRSGLQYSRLNGISHNQAHPREVIETARERLAGVPWIWEVTEESHPETRDALTAWGAQHYTSTVVMELDLTRSSSYLPSAQLSGVSEWTPGGDHTEWVRGWASAMWLPEVQIERAARIDEARGDDGGRIVRYAFTADGEIRATTELLLAGGVAGIYLVATQEAYGRRGMATALVSAALLRAREEGMPLATLQASGDGEPVYRRMGFEPVSAVHAYSSPPV